ncbi:hypothetical protein IE81DRAFT_134927 [Ceraceosorus guamensis]|uniref:Uncharacterized protein n=1 Tax=Ceraceosorus guamensis TaxID=1522189 RepID=A0A316VYH5_9BASI|nr:hypothetical protein IE81DRAFT_134927 [Ceraceosorus guamensis]PWN42384.1 hypothetical protein IE81DRAFT_134927 [Ceraceosorus guamensis]
MYDSDSRLKHVHSWWFDPGAVDVQKWCASKSGVGCLVFNSKSVLRTAFTNYRKERMHPAFLHFAGLQPHLGEKLIHMSTLIAGLPHSPQSRRCRTLEASATLMTRGPPPT